MNWIKKALLRWILKHAASGKTKLDLPDSKEVWVQVRDRWRKENETKRAEEKEQEKSESPNPIPDFTVELDAFAGTDIHICASKESTYRYLEALGLEEELGDLDEFDQTYAGFAWHLEKKGEHLFLMHLPDLTIDSVVYHESLHMAWNVLDHMGVFVSADNHEMLAYLQGHLVDRILDHTPRTKL